MIYGKEIIAIPPGVTIKEQLEDRDMSQKEFAIRMDISEKHVSKLMHGEVPLTHDVAMRLEFVLGIPSTFWENLEAIFRRKLESIKDEKELNAEVKIAQQLPIDNMVRYGWLPETADMQNTVFELRKFFEVSRLSLVGTDPLSHISIQATNKQNGIDYALLAWIQKARLEARKASTNRINIQRLQRKVQEIRRLTTLQPDNVTNRLETLFSECGIALVLLPQLMSSPFSGVTFRYGKKIVLGMTTLDNYSDKFWVNLFREIAHIILGHLGDTTPTDEREKTADECAQDLLIPRPEYESFVRDNNLEYDSISAFATQIGVSPGIVLNRLQEDSYIRD